MPSKKQRQQYRLYAASFESYGQKPSLTEEQFCARLDRARKGQLERERRFGIARILTSPDESGQGTQPV